jgi:hypothetical protein
MDSREGTDNTTTHKLAKDKLDKFYITRLQGFTRRYIQHNNTPMESHQIR